MSFADVMDMIRVVAIAVGVIAAIRWKLRERAYRKRANAGELRSPVPEYLLEQRARTSRSQHEAHVAWITRCAEVHAEEERDAELARKAIAYEAMLREQRS